MSSRRYEAGDAVVQAVENLTEVRARVVGSAPHPRLDGWDQVDVDIEAAAAVPGYADLLSRRVGERLPLAVRHELIGDVAPGAVIECRAKLHLGEAMAQPHPEPGLFRVATS